MYKQRSSWSKGSIIVSLTVLAFMIGTGIVFIMHDPKNGHFAASILFGTVVIMCLMALCFCPLQVEVDGDALNIAFSLRNKTIPLSEIRSVKPYKVHTARNFFRVCGSGAFFGWWGWYKNKELGRFMVYASNLQKTVLIELRGGKKYLISCSDPAALIATIRHPQSTR